tara:strand:- start:230 stop:1156 length:927 start_codon:yes stop_codon:yes gene_type:complete
MSNSIIIKENFFLNWLRPENVPWDVHKALIFQKHFFKKKFNSTLEVGTGNGVASFISLKGKFDPSFDWYIHANPKNFFKNQDIYNYFYKSKLSKKKIIIKKAITKFDLAIDYKKNLLDLAYNLDISKNYKVHDCNKQLITKKKFDFIYSNILYWLKNPYEKVNRISKLLDLNGVFLFSVPNENYLKYCQSYSKKGKLWNIINRGRKNTLQKIFPQKSFENFLKKNNFEILKKERMLSSKTLKIWDLGLRPISPFLIEMSNSISDKSRNKIKMEWCDKLFPIVKELTEEEIFYGNKDGGYSFYLIKKKF